MSVLKCKMCGGDLEVTEDIKIIECEYCGTNQTVPNADNEKKINLFNRANRLRMASEFDKAAGIYENIIAEFPEEAEAYWGLCLCNYGIEYVDDPATAKKIPTCHRASFESLQKDENFELALEYADVVAQKIYRDEAREIDRIMNEILAVSKNEKPYDVFICYKETDEKGERTIDSVLAYDIYDALTAKGFNVFFSRVTLEDKLGRQYEPYIFAALNSAKVMLSIGTKYEYFHAVWVKNEWSRFLKLMAKDKSKVLIPCFKDIDAYDMPEEFKALQAQDMGKLGAVQDIVRGIEKIVGNKSATETVVINNANANIAPLLKRAFMFLEDGDFNRADEFCEQVLNLDPECAEAYLGKLLVSLKVKKREELKNCSEPFDDNNYYQKAIRFADASLKNELEGCIEFIVNRNLTVIYENAVSIMNSADSEIDYKRAHYEFKKAGNFKDAEALAKECNEKAEKERLEAGLKQKYLEAKKIIERAISQEELSKGIELLESLGDYKDSLELKNKYKDDWRYLKDFALNTWKEYNEINAKILAVTKKIGEGASPYEKEIQQSKDLLKKIKQKNKRLVTVKTNCNQAQHQLTMVKNELSKLGVFAFSKKKELTEKADRFSAVVEETSKEIDQIEKFLNSVASEQDLKLAIETQKRQLWEYNESIKPLREELNVLNQQNYSLIEKLENRQVIAILVEDESNLSELLSITSIVTFLQIDDELKNKIKSSKKFRLLPANLQKKITNNVFDAEAIYYQACQAMENARSMDDIIWAKDEFFTIKQYKDSNELLLKCEEMIIKNTYKMC